MSSLAAEFGHNTEHYLGEKVMRFGLRILLLSFLPVFVAAQESEIENEYNAYSEDFMVFDIEGIASHFTLPVMFIGESTQVMQDAIARKSLSQR